MHVGIDIVEIARLGRILGKYRSFVQKAFTRTELAEANAMAPVRRAEFLAGRFALKESVMKALGTGWSGGIAFTDIQAESAAGGGVKITLTGAAAARATELGTTNIVGNVTHKAGLALGFAVLTCSSDEERR
jgi:holo-[acyl-carrier protein] synthase